METKTWHKYVSIYEHWRSRGLKTSRDILYVKLLEEKFEKGLSLWDNTAFALLDGVELLWYRTGQPTWLIPRDLIGLLESAKIDSDCSGIHMPHDSFVMCFEKGSEIDGLPLRSLLVASIRSKLSLKVIPEMRINTEAEVAIFKESLFTAADMGITREGIEPDTRFPVKIVGVWPWTGVFDSEGGATTGTIEIRGQTTKRVLSLAMAVLMYHAARPERLSAFTLPRSQRYEFKGTRENIKLLRLPTMKTVVAHPGMAAAGGYQVKPHFRGWVYRVLRDERYQRNTDGTFKVIEVPPTVIHPELMPGYENWKEEVAGQNRTEGRS